MRREERIKDLIILGLAKNRKEAEKAIKIHAAGYLKQNTRMEKSRRFPMTAWAGSSAAGL